MLLDDAGCQFPRDMEQAGVHLRRMDFWNFGQSRVFEKMRDSFVCSGNDHVIGINEARVLVAREEATNQIRLLHVVLFVVPNTMGGTDQDRASAEGFWQVLAAVLLILQKSVFEVVSEFGGDAGTPTPLTVAGLD